MNTPENQNYLGNMPTVEMYGDRTMQPKAHSESIKWYNTVKNIFLIFKT